MTIKDEVHNLVDNLPEADLVAVLPLLRRLLDRQSDPFLQALAAAEADDEPETAEERAAVDRARQDIAQGKVWSDGEVARDLKLE